MAKLPWKRDDTSAEPPSLSAYLPSESMDYTSLPIVEDESTLERLRSLPVGLRVALGIVPFVVIAACIFIWMAFVRPAPVEIAAPPPPPAQLSVEQARVVNPEEIAVAGTTQNVVDGTEMSARLLADGVPTGWISSTASVGTVQGGLIDVRLRKAEGWDRPLAATAAYTIELTLATTPPVKTLHALVVPAPLADAFYGSTVAAVVPTAVPEPTTPPPAKPTPTSAPIPAQQIPTVVAHAGATLLISPTLGSDAISTAPNGSSYQPLLRTPDSQFFLVLEGNRVGWLAAKDATIDAAQVAQIAMTTPSKAAVEAGPLHATVWHGGNIRYGPSLKTGTVLGQAEPGDVVTLKASTADRMWYHIVAPAAEGWLHVSLLKIDPRVAANVPRATP